MDELVKSIFTAPIATLFIVSGMLFLLIAIVGNISGKIEPGQKARMLSGALGFSFLCLGLAMHWLQKTSDISESPAISTQQPKSEQSRTPSETSLTGATVPKQDPVPGRQSAQKPEAVSSSIQTIYDGVIASVVRFEKTGNSVMLQLLVRNSARQMHRVCFQPRRTELIAEATGESWTPKEAVGQECTRLAANNSHRIWMKFDVAEPENKSFSLSSPLFNGTLDNLVIAEPSQGSF
jgi:hypothetical protein